MTAVVVCYGLILLLSASFHPHFHSIMSPWVEVFDAHVRSWGMLCTFHFGQTDLIVGNISHNTGLNITSKNIVKERQ